MSLRRWSVSSLVPFFAVAAVAVLGACTVQPNDQPADAGPPAPLGKGLRIAQVMNPNSPEHPASGGVVNITGATFLLVDTFDETGDGKSVGTVYLQDTGSSAPYAGASLYEPAYEPTSLSPAPGDVLDLTGAYDAQASIGSETFAAGEALIQISKPNVTFRFEYLVPPPTVIQVTDLNNYSTGLQWSAMLVQVNNVTLGSTLSNSAGRVTAYITPVLTGAGAEISNELFDLETWNNAQPTKLVAGTKLQSLTGIVTWFTEYHIAPRSPADIVFE